MITVFYYNPNISFSEEYRKRVAEQKRLIAAYNKEEKGWPIDIVEGDYEPERFMRWRRGMRTAPREESGASAASICGCVRRRNWRLPEALIICNDPDHQPSENAAKINEIGQALSGEYGIPWLPSDFKKKNGYKRSIELSAEYELYRQNYCGCAFPRRSGKHRL